MEEIERLALTVRAEAALKPQEASASHSTGRAPSWLLATFLAIVISGAVLFAILLCDRAGVFRRLPGSYYSGSKPPPPTHLTRQEATYIVSLYRENAVNADNQFLGKVLAVHGAIQSIGKTISDEPYVEIYGGGLLGVQCVFDAADRAALDRLGGLRAGEDIVIVGTCAGKLGTVILRDCRIYAGIAQ